MTSKDYRGKEVSLEYGKGAGDKGENDYEHSKDA